MTATETSRRLGGRVAIVTGAGWNIGRAVALRFAAEGAAVVVASRRAALLEETAAAIRAAGGETMVVPTDAADPAQVDALVARTLERYGTVDVLAALAGRGFAGPRLEETPVSAWEAVFRANVLTAFLCARAVLPVMRRANRGSVLTCAGGGAFFPVMGEGYGAYACAKAAVCRFTDQMTAELWETGIRFHCMEPGKVLSPDRLAAIAAEEERTGRPSPEREGHRPPEEAAELAAWLVSDASLPLRGRCVSVSDTWWREPGAAAAVERSVSAYRLRRAEQ